jgi:hypothetical protein
MANDARRRHVVDPGVVGGEKVWGLSRGTRVTLERQPQL